MLLHVHLRARAVVHGELEGDDDVVLHAADLAAEGDALLAEAVGGLLVLEGVDLHLLLHAAARGGGVLAEQGIVECHTLLSKHIIEESHHGVLDFFCSKYAVSIARVVYAKAHVWKAVQSPLVMLSLEAQIALDHDHDLTEHKVFVVFDAPNVTLDQGKLFLGLCMHSITPLHALHTRHARLKKIKSLNDTFAAHEYVNANNLCKDTDVSKDSRTVAHYSYLYEYKQGAHPHIL